MVNVRTEYPEGYKILYETPNNVHTNLQEEKEFENKDLVKDNSEKEIMQDESIIESCPNEKVEITALTSGAIAKIPIVLAAFTVRVNISSSIDFSEPIFQIKEILKKISIQQCTLIHGSNTLFIEGYIKKNIIHYTSNHRKNNEIHGEVQTLDADIPFKCTTIFKYNLMNPEDIINSTKKEFKYISNCDYLNKESNENDEIIGDNSSYNNQVVTDYYNEEPYCEVIGSKLVESEILLEENKIIDKDLKNVGICAIEGEGILYITIRVLQNRLVSIPMIPQK